MAKVVVLGGCGAVGSVAVETLAGQDIISEVVVADHAEEKARQLAGRIASPKVSAAFVDAFEPETIRRAIRGAEVVLNCIGPFYSTVKPILTAVVDAGINYVDICDDVDVTLEILDMDDQARARGVTALIGMGSSPGATNLLARLAYDTLLDETDAVDIFHTHGGEAIEGEGVIAHRFHCMSIDIPMYLDGKLTAVKYFEPDGVALRQTFDFPMIGRDI
nr:saccharopine dehydrogenase NADP-binding domain-containing protein [Deltaproteobacteria bacterium]